MQKGRHRHEAAEFAEARRPHDERDEAIDARPDAVVEERERTEDADQQRLAERFP